MSGSWHAACTGPWAWSCLDQLGRNAEVEDLSETFKRHPTLGVNLLRLVNSAALARRHRISTLPAALAFLGRRQLRRSIMLLLFAGSDAQGLSNPLLQMAARRGRVMELVAGGGDAAQPQELADQAFPVGMLSLMDALLRTPLDALADQLICSRRWWTARATSARCSSWSRRWSRTGCPLKSRAGAWDLCWRRARTTGSRCSSSRRRPAQS